MKLVCLQGYWLRAGITLSLLQLTLRLSPEDLLQCWQQMGLLEDCAAMASDIYHVEKYVCDKKAWASTCLAGGFKARCMASLCSVHVHAFTSPVRADN